jgi:uncharacterized protein YodC (DUF2158 family)
MGPSDPLASWSHPSGADIKSGMEFTVGDKVRLRGSGRVMIVSLVVGDPPPWPWPGPGGVECQWFIQDDLQTTVLDPATLDGSSMPRSSVRALAAPKHCNGRQFPTPSSVARPNGAPMPTATPHHQLIAVARTIARHRAGYRPSRGRGADRGSESDLARDRSAGRDGMAQTAGRGPLDEVCAPGAVGRHRSRDAPPLLSSDYLNDVEPEHAQAVQRLAQANQRLDQIMRDSGGCSE